MPLRVGIIGTGMAFERLHLPAYQELQDRYQIYALCDTDRERVHMWAQRLQIPPDRVYTDFRAMVRRGDLDVVDIMVPIPDNLPVTQAVAASAPPSLKGIICEKPLAANREQAEIARELPRRYQIPILIAEQYRYNEEIDWIRDWIWQGRIGRVWYFMQHRVVNFPAEMRENTFAAREWRQHPNFPGGIITDIAVHDLAALRHIFGAIERVQALGNPIEADFAPYGVLQANILFKSGFIGHYTFSCLGLEYQRPLVGLRIFGEHGQIYLEERDAGVVNIFFPDGSSQQIPYRPQRGFSRELLNFHQALSGEEAISVPPEMEFGDLMTVLAMIESAQARGKPVAVDREAAYVLG
ncbi:MULTISPECIES: Gfo/Idh/MocA family protein [Limnochorda]|uniref:Gfo/Idh/MocA family protein n=1 Tax=Limnochorda TaxID=1676651 RepID=UPI0017FE9F7F|nr:Gfo/Idh/MocA family oxidoreductase [Limnochorda pilosa]MBO2486436.1 oxidoreductase [Bacillota bacterium]MBO2520011.1 oxidoreductase [Bacillota bacterium]NMA72074.1 Gfo/Idh/MocA family oxidoreductase [Bacillota bacterium]